MNRFGDVDAYYNLALAHESVGQWAQASDAWAEAKYLAPQDRDIFDGHAECLARAGGNSGSKTSDEDMQKRTDELFNHIFSDPSENALGQMRALVSKGIEVDSKSDDGVPLLVLAVNYGNGATGLKYPLNTLVGDLVEHGAGQHNFCFCLVFYF